MVTLKQFALAFAPVYAKKIDMRTSRFATFVWSPQPVSTSSREKYSKRWHARYGPARWINPSVWIDADSILSIKNSRSTEWRLTIPEAVLVFLDPPSPLPPTNDPFLNWDKIDNDFRFNMFLDWLDEYGVETSPIRSLAVARECA